VVVFFTANEGCRLCSRWHFKTGHLSWHCHGSKQTTWLWNALVLTLNR